MTADQLSPPGRKHPARILGWCALFFWFVSLIGPVDNQNGMELAITTIALLFHGGGFEFGPWAALANFLIPGACAVLIMGKRPRWSVLLIFLLVVTSPGFWAMQQHFAVKALAVPAWTASIVLVIIGWGGSRNVEAVPGKAADNATAT